MQSFRENCCRLCSKTFCCVQCRSYHEESFHKVNPECEICIYGRATIKEASASLLSHIKKTHWPLHCVFCKKVFISLDELLPHDKCSVKIEHLTMQTTPKTPINDKETSSPQVTPFYKNVKIQQSGATMAATSTPLIQKEESEKITPINQSEICCPYKSSLKLTGSSNLSDSKKSERRVTFSETPSVSDFGKKHKYFPLAAPQIQIENDDSSDDSFASVEEVFKTAATYLERNENLNTENFNFDSKFNLNGTLFETALSKSDSNSTSKESLNKSSHFNVSLQINVINNTIATEASILKQVDNSNYNQSIWSSMTKMVKSVVNNISLSAQNGFSSVGVKRRQPEIDEAPSLKRMKFVDIKCRRPLRDTSPSYFQKIVKPRYVDKATQTEEIWM